MFKIRKNCFETNSSSTHSICICTKSDYEDWKAGLAKYDYYNEKLINLPISDIKNNPSFESEVKSFYNGKKRSFWKDWEEITEEDKLQWVHDYIIYTQPDEKDLISYDGYLSKSRGLEHFTENFVTPLGEEIVAFGYYGYE